MDIYLWINIAASARGKEAEEEEQLDRRGTQEPVNRR